MGEILVASSNLHKIKEMQEILTPYQITLLSPKEVGGIPEVVEDGITFQENATKKAVEIAKATGKIALADDSGLEVVALNGEPGVYSARYAGEGGNDGRNVQKLLAKLQNCRERGARFVCVIAVATPAGLVGTAEGEVRGRIAQTPAGEGGFGYDPIFIPEGYEETFAQLPGEVKNLLSHRARALQAALEKGLLP